ncbi:biotin/lipoyl-binding protein [Klebsiella pneumoniae subsp. pneumoniae]|nr:biotin/lipoyl-binding protein [Klebsiella pneumoniae subsp. pneumoniae]
MISLLIPASQILLRPRINKATQTKSLALSIDKFLNVRFHNQIISGLIYDCIAQTSHVVLNRYTGCHRAVPFKTERHTRARIRETSNFKTVRTTSAVVHTVNDWAEFSGKLEATDEVAVRSKVTGSIVDVKFRDGQLVRKGDILFIIDPAPYKTELSRARAAYAQAKAKQDLALLDLSRGKNLSGPMLSHSAIMTF